MGAALTSAPAAAVAETKAASGSRRLAWSLAVGAVLVISRWALVPAYLATFDEINFAFAIRDFNPMLHQPQPPGFPVFVGLLKLVSLLVPKVETVFLVAALIVSGVALVAMWWLCEGIVGRGRGLIGVLLLLFNPAFWLSALTNPVRLCFAAGAIAVAGCVWLACRESQTRWFPLAAAALGLSAGARPELVIMMAPLLIWAAVRARMRWKVAAVSVLCFAVAVSTWLPSLLIAVGGLGRYVTIIRAYSNAQFSGTSALFGATLRDAIHMAWKAVVWSCLGALSWVWAILLLKRTAKPVCDAFTLRFLGLWFFPGILFYAIFHVGDPDHTLSIVPVLCVAGCLVLASVARHASRRKTAIVVSVCVLLNVFLFLKPISTTDKASTYPPIRWMSGFVAEVVGNVHRMRRTGPVTVVFNDEIGEWRHLSYYEPGAHLVLIGPGRDGAMMARNVVANRVVAEASPIRTVSFAPCGMLVFVDPFVQPVTKHGAGLQAINSRFYFAPAAAAGSIEYRGVHFVSNKQACEAN